LLVHDGVSAIYILGWNMVAVVNLAVLVHPAKGLGLGGGDGIGRRYGNDDECQGSIYANFH